MAKKKKKDYYTKTFTFVGKRYYVRAIRKGDLEEKVAARKAELEEEKARAGAIYTGEETLNQYFERWEAGRRGTVKESTICNQRKWFRTLSKTVVDNNSGLTFGNLKLNQINRQAVIDLQRIMRDAKQKDGTAKFCSNSINCYINLLKHILSDAADNKVITENPARGLKNLQRTEVEAVDTIHRALTQEETDLFFEAAKESYYLNHFKFMLCTGCRCGEVGALTPSCIDQKANCIRIEKTLTKDENGKMIIGSSTKTKKSKRTIPLSQQRLDIIQSQKEIRSILDQDRREIRFGAPIFTAPEGGLLNVTCVNREIERICRKAGIEKFTCHSFRDTFATRCIEQGMNPNTLKKLLGHRSLSMTMDLYAHVLPETAQEELDKVRFAI